MSDVDDRLDRLESLIEDQRDTIERQRERIDELETNEDAAARQPGRGTEGWSTTPENADGARLSRRSTLKTGGLLGLLGLGAGFGAGNVAAQSTSTPAGQVGTSGRPLQSMYTAELNGPVTGGTAVSDLVGDGLETAGGVLRTALGNGLGFDAAGRATIPSGAVGGDEIADGSVSNSELTDTSLSVAGNAVSLGGSTGVTYGDLDGPENVVVVAKSGGDYADVPTALNDVTGPAVVWVGPGEFDLTDRSDTPDIPSGVSLVGAGRAATTLYNDSFSALAPSNHAEIRSLTLEQRGDVAGAENIVDKSGATEFVMEDVKVTTTTTAEHTGIDIPEGTVFLRNSSVELANNAESTGIFVHGGTVTVRDSVIAGGDGEFYYAIDVFSGTANLANSQIINGIRNEGTVNRYGNYDGSYSAL